MPEKYLVVLQHPVTHEYHEAKTDVTKTLQVINDLAIPTFWFWPNVDAGADGTSNGIRSFREKQNRCHEQSNGRLDEIRIRRGIDE